MRKKGLISLIFLLVCFLLILFSYFAWSDSLASVTRPALGADSSSKEDESEPPAEETGNTEAPSLSYDPETLSNLDDSVRAVFEDRLQKGESLQFLFLGSDLMDMGEPSMYTLVSDALTSTYGDSIDISKQTFNETSLNVMEEQLISFDGGYDIILFEPFTLKNNGEIDMETEHAHIASIVESFQDEVADAAIVFTPSNPIYNATYYPVQIDGLKTYLTKNEYTLVDHWDYWPDPKDELIKEYLDDKSRPNEKGAAAWAQALIPYFTGNN